MISITRARAIRHAMEEAAAEYTDEKAYTLPEMFPLWHSDKSYSVGDRVRYEDNLYKCLTAHDAQPSWMPDVSPSLWVRIDDPAIEWPEWVQPVGSTDAYRIGAKVSHSDKHWISQIDYNTYEPGVYGWEEVNG